MLKKKFTIILVIMIILALTGICNKIYAATSSISTSKNSVKVGDTITVTISGNAASWNVNLLSNGPVKANGTTSFSNATDSGENENITIGTVTYTATADGTVSFNLAGQLVDSNYKSSDASGSAKVTVSSQSSNTKNANNNNTNNNNNNTNNNNNSNTNNKTTTQEPTFTASNKTAYATGDINVRSSYSSSSSAVGSLKKGDSVTIIGVGSNGWSKVTYNGKTAYIKSDLLTSTKPAEDEKSANKALKSLEIESVSLEPEFNKETTNYSVTVGKDVDSLKINAQAEDEKAKVTIAGNEQLKIGENTIKISVTAEDGTVRTYTVIAKKQEKDALGLESLKISGVSLNKAFNPNTYEYTVDLKGKEDLTKLDITAKANIQDATVEIIGNENFIVGENVVTIMVKSKDGKENVTYQILVNKPEKGSTTTEIVNENTGITNSKMFLYVAIGIFSIALLLIIIIIVRSIKKSKEEDYDSEDAYGFNYSDDNNITEELYGIRNNKLNEEDEQPEISKTKLYDVEKEVDFSEEERKPRKKGKHSK